MKEEIWRHKKEGEKSANKLCSAIFSVIWHRPYRHSYNTYCVCISLCVHKTIIENVTHCSATFAFFVLFFGVRCCTPFSLFTVHMRTLLCYCSMNAQQIQNHDFRIQYNKNKSNKKKKNTRKINHVVHTPRKKTNNNNRDEREIE